MSHVRQDTLVTCAEWAKHLRKRGKKQHTKSERQASRKLVSRELKETSRRKEG